jgi:hypothetical protein
MPSLIRTTISRQNRIHRQIFFFNGKYRYINKGKVNKVPKYKRGIPEVLTQRHIRIKLQTKARKKTPKSKKPPQPLTQQ